MINLFPFQADAATQIADRYRDFISDPARPSRRGYGPLPYYQTLRALTGAGKTPILAVAVSEMRIARPIEPIVLWISKGKVVVDQTLTNFSEGGKYAHLLPHFHALALRDTVADQVHAGNGALILLGTVATFNSKERGDRRIFERGQDASKESLWESLIDRTLPTGEKRPLIVVYDEGHNLTDQQGDLLLELQPDALVVASATPRLPARIIEFIDFLKLNEYTDNELTTSIHSTAVVDAQLVKRELLLGGYMTAEEVAISAMLEERKALIIAARTQEVTLTPKCIYVCRTNDPGDSQKPFLQRTAPPIRIWRYLVEQQGIDPAAIAVYCQLDVSQAYPLPDQFTLFRGGDDDYADFIAGNYQHIIFNRSLQEGWDDPECYMAYIDKSMGSDLQVEQIVGRVLRQPNAQYYADPRLNTCNFFIHLDETGVFRSILNRVQEQIARDLPGVDVRPTGGDRRTLLYHEPRQEARLPALQLDTEYAAEAVEAVLNEVQDYEKSIDAQAVGLVAEASQQIGSEGPLADLTWAERGYGMPVTVGWLLTREVVRLYRDAFVVCDMEDERFKRPVHLGSRAAQNIQRLARVVVETFLQHVEISARPSKTKVVGSSPYNAEDYHCFTNSLHPSYSNLKENELVCARAIDALGWPWCRNPSNGGFSLPLLQLSRTQNFFPDFLVWTDNMIWAIDPKGDHLIKEDAGRKIIAVDNDGRSTTAQQVLKVCLITDGRWSPDGTKLPSETGVVSSWTLRGGRPVPTAFGDINKLLTRVVGKNPAV